MSLRDNESYFTQARVIPVLTPGTVADGVALSRVLFEAGLRMQEITLRTAAGLDTIAALKQQLPELIVGAGSVLTPELAVPAQRQSEYDTGDNQKATGVVKIGDRHSVFLSCWTHVRKDEIQSAAAGDGRSGERECRPIQTGPAGT